MRVVLTDGTEFSCRNFTAIDSGVLLTKDKKRKKVVGFVPHHQLRYVVGDDLELVDPREDEAHSVSPGETLDVDPSTTAAISGADSEEDGEIAGGDVSATSDLRRLGGLGSTYAERLQAAGYETLADLAVANPVAVAEAASVAPGRGRRWVTAAGRAVADEEHEEGVDDSEQEDVDGTEEPIETDDEGEDDGDDADRVEGDEENTE